MTWIENRKKWIGWVNEKIYGLRNLNQIVFDRKWKIFLKNVETVRIIYKS